MTTPTTRHTPSPHAWNQPNDRRSPQRAAALTGPHATSPPSPPSPRRRSPRGPLPSSTRAARARRWTTLAAEATASYDAASDGSDGSDAGADAEVAVVEVAAAAARVAALDTDALTSAELEGLVEGLRRPMAQLDAARARAFADLERRAVQQAPSNRIAGARDEQRRRNAEQHRLSRSDAKRAAEAGRAAADHPATGAAFREGKLGAEHARTIGDTLQHVSPDRREEVEERLLSLAEDSDPNAFGRAARELLGKEAPASAAQAERRQQLRRSVRMSDTPDGGFAFSGLLYGTAAEAARTAIHAFRTPDAPDEHRTTEQRNADAFEQLCEVALRVGDAPTQHGVRPHILVIVEEADLLDAGGTARLGQSGQPVTLSSLQHLLSDCTVSRLVRDAAGTPMEASEGVRTVPQGLWRALLARDGGCTWDGCDAPASWCDVAHGQTAFCSGGVLSPSNAALLCRRHHRRFDANDDIVLVIDGDRVSYRHLTRAAAPPARTADAPGTATSGPEPPTAGPDPPPSTPGGSQTSLPFERDPPEPPAPEHPPG